MSAVELIAGFIYAAGLVKWSQPPYSRSGEYTRGLFTLRHIALDQPVPDRYWRPRGDR